MTAEHCASPASDASAARSSATLLQRLQTIGLADRFTLSASTHQVIADAPAAREVLVAVGAPTSVRSRGRLASGAGCGAQGVGHQSADPAGSASLVGACLSMSSWVAAQLASRFRESCEGDPGSAV